MPSAMSYVQAPFESTTTLACSANRPVTDWSISTIGVPGCAVHGAGGALVGGPGGVGGCGVALAVPASTMMATRCFMPHPTRMRARGSV